MANNPDKLNNSGIHDQSGISFLNDSTTAIIRTENNPNQSKQPQTNKNLIDSDRRKTLMSSLKQNVQFASIFNKVKESGKKSTEKITIREKEVSTMKRYMKISDTIAAILAVLSAIFSYIENESFYNQETDNETVTMDPTVTSSTSNDILRGVIIVFTLAICAGVYLHYVWKLRLLKLKKLRLQDDTMRSSGLLWRLLLELIVCAVCSPPYIDFTFSGSILGGTYIYSWDAIVSVIMLGKSYLVLRLYAQYSHWTGEKAIKVCKRYKCKADYTFAIKAELKHRPYLILAFFMLITIVYLGLALKTFERSFTIRGIALSFDFNYISNAFWVTIITMTTVGFGDGYPRTHLGRFIGVIACIIGMLLISLMVVSLTNASELTPEESKAFFALKKAHLREKAKDKAANIIKTLFKLRKVSKADTVRKTLEKFVWIIKLRVHASIYKNDYRVANSINLPINEMLVNLQSKLVTDISDIKKELSSVSELETRCSSLKDRQQKLGNKMDDIIKLQGFLGDYLMKTHNLAHKGTAYEIQSSTLTTEFDSVDQEHYQRSEASFHIESYQKKEYSSLSSSRISKSLRI